LGLDSVAIAWEKMPQMELDKKTAGFRNVNAPPPRSASPRICIPTWRNFTTRAYRCGLYEAQDVLAEIDEVDLISLDMSWGKWFTETWLRRPLYHDVSRKLIFANPGLKKVQLSRDYDAFIAVCSTFWDVPYINAIERWKDHCKISVCWIDELWACQIQDYRYWLPALAQFDYVFTGYKGTVFPLSQAINRPCHWLPGGADTFRFSPLPDPGVRVIDVYSIGRRYQGIHREMLKAAKRGEMFYVHDTHVNLGYAEVYDHQQHRDLYANMAKRSRYFMVGAPKMDAPDERQGQVEVGYRYYEGSAAGTVMIGEAPDCEAYRELFGWPEAVIPVQPDGSDIIAVLSGLGSDPERTAAIGRRNARKALLQHDWVYRWNEMFRVAGIRPSPNMAARERRLKEMADFAHQVR
jgi:Glycosyl transferases group 1